MTYKEYQKSRRNAKHYQKGDIVYWIRTCENSKRRVIWGVVCDEFTDGVLVNRYVVKDYQTCDGVPVTDMTLPTSWKKLPKDWTYDTRLFEIGCSLSKEELDLGNRFVRGEFDNDKNAIRKMIEDGFLVPAVEAMHFDNGHIESEVEKGRFRLVYRWNVWTHEIGQATYRWNELYDTYDEAAKVIAQELAECQYVASLSEYGYAVWDMNERLEKWRTPNMTDEFIGEIRDWLLQLSDFEDYEFRGTCGGFQYKKIGNKKWLTVGISEER